MLTTWALEGKMNPGCTKSLRASEWSKTYQASWGSWLIGQTKVKWKKDFTGYLRISSLLFIFSLFLA